MDFERSQFSQCLFHQLYEFVTGIFERRTNRKILSADKIPVGADGTANSTYFGAMAQRNIP